MFTVVIDFLLGSTLHSRQLTMLAGTATDAIQRMVASVEAEYGSDAALIACEVV